MVGEYYLQMCPQFFILLQCTSFLTWLPSSFHREVVSAQTPLYLGQPCGMPWPIDCNRRVKSELYTLCVSDFSFEAYHRCMNKAQLDCWMLRIMGLSYLYYPGQLACQPPEMGARPSWSAAHQTTLQLNAHVRVSSTVHRSCPRSAEPLSTDSSAVILLFEAIEFWGSLLLHNNYDN